MTRRQRHNNRQRGFTLIELMISALLFLIMSLAIFGILAISEGKKRTTTSVNDINQNGNFVLYRLGNLIRDAGAGFSAKSIAPPGQGAVADWQKSYGCLLNAVSGGATLLPLATLPKPFDHVLGITGSPRLAPIVIVANGSNLTPNNTSDVLIIMSSTAGFAQDGIPFTSPVNGAVLNLLDSIGIFPNDLLLIVDTPGGGPAGNCAVEQVASGFTAATSTTSSSPGVSLATTGSTTYYINPSGYSVNSRVFGIGNLTDRHPPSFLMFGVGPDNSNAGAIGRALYSYDLLQTTGASPELMASGVYEIHALYGIDTTGSGTVTAWADPSVAPYDAATLLNGSVASATNLLSIKAIRLGLVLRTSLLEQNVAASSGVGTTPVSPATLTLFSDLSDANGTSLAHTVKLTDTNYGQNFRWRTFEATIALRNPLN